jgi:hypothetical protein
VIDVVVSTTEIAQSGVAESPPVTELPTAEPAATSDEVLDAVLAEITPEATCADAGMAVDVTAALTEQGAENAPTAARGQNEPTGKE